MKVLLIERAMDGHRGTYAKWLSKIEEHEMFLYAPENVGLDEKHYVLYQRTPDRSLKEYLTWTRKIRDIVLQNRIDVVHFLDGDSIMRYFGLGFGRLGTKRIVITYHHLFSGRLRRISYRQMCRGRKRRCVVHTESIQKSLQMMGVENVVLCRYPAFNFDRLASLDSAACKQKFGLSEAAPVIGIVGGMSRYKNIIPFLEVLRSCKEDFQLLICGQENDITGGEIEKAVEPYQQKVSKILRKLTDEEYEAAIAASDIIFCIYGHEFDGASGPLTDGVCARKMSLSCAHGSLGEIVKQNHLGFTARCDDSSEIRVATEEALKSLESYSYDPMAEGYRSSLAPQTFQERHSKEYAGSED